MVRGYLVTVPRAVVVCRIALQDFLVLDIAVLHPDRRASRDWCIWVFAWQSSHTKASAFCKGTVIGAGALWALVECRSISISP